MKTVRRIEHVRPLILFAGLACVASVSLGAVQPEAAKFSSIPQWKRQLTGDAALKVQKLERQIGQLQREGRFSEAVGPAGEAAETRGRDQGADHWQSQDARRTVDTLRAITALPEEGRTAIKLAVESEEKAAAEREAGRYRAAERLFRQVLDIRRRWLGEDHADIAASNDDIAGTLYMQAKFPESQKLLRAAMTARQKSLGERHPKTAETYNNLATVLSTIGRLAEAEPFISKSLTIRLDALGEDDPEIAFSYNSLGLNLYRRGKYAEAEPFLNKALAIRLRTLGESHAATAFSLDNVAINLAEQGKYTEAEQLQRKSLAVRRKMLGEGHPEITQSYNNLAQNLVAQARYAEAEPLTRKALAVCLKTVGESHATTATCYHNVASNLSLQGKYAEAEPLLRKALAIAIKTRGNSSVETGVFNLNLAVNLDKQEKPGQAEPIGREGLAIILKSRGENHPLTAQAYTVLATSLRAHGKYTEAEPLLRKALEIRRKAVGETNGYTSYSYYNLAQILGLLGKYAEAEPLLRRALAISLDAGWKDHRYTATIYDGLAMNLDDQGKLSEAVSNWIAATAIQDRVRGAQASSGLERSFEENHSALVRLAVALARQGDRREAWARWEAGLARGLLDEISARSLRPMTDDQRRREADLEGQTQKLEERIARLIGQARRTKDQDVQLEQFQRQQNDLRAQWTEFQNSLGQQYQAYAGKPSTLNEIQKAVPADAALVGWLDLEKHHWACVVRHEGEPIWVRMSGSGKEGAWTKEDIERARAFRLAVIENRPGWAAQAGSLAQERIAPLIPHLKEVKQLIVLPSNAMAGVAVDVLVAALPSGSPQPVVSYAPSGSMFARLTAPRTRTASPPRLMALGDPAFPKPVATDSAPAPPYHGIAIESVARDGSLASLPGTRREVQAIAALFPEGQVRLLLGADATESALQGLAQSGALKDFGFLHLATHGKSNPAVALSSTIFLAAEPNRPEGSLDPAMVDSILDGEVTAEQIVRTWNLDADLVVLSACESGLGRYEGGEGYLGFAQALFVKGARSLVLSQWRVDDRATSLLMTRFYQNLLGRRPGLVKPIPKSSALHEAKGWLRNLSIDEAGIELAGLERGGVRPLAKDGGKAPRDLPNSSKAGGDRPFAHPYYWAAFILVGDPN